MNTRVQGTVCLTMGLVGLAIYLFSSGGAADRNLTAAPSTSPVLVPLADDSWQVTYWGSSTKRLPTESSTTSWTVTLFGLPKDAQANRIVLLSCVGQPLTRSDWGAEPTPQSKGVFAFQVDSSGDLQEIIRPTGIDLTNFPVDLLLHPNPKNQSREGYARSPAIGLSSANQLSLQPMVGASEDGTCTYNVVGKVLPLAIEGGQRRVQLSYDHDTNHVRTLDAQTQSSEQGSEVRHSLKLRWGHTTQITQDRVAAIRKDLNRWFKYSAEVRNIVGTATYDADQGRQTYNLRLSRMFSELKEDVPLCLDPLTEDLLQQFTTSPGLTYHRVQLGYDAMRRLRDDHERLDWKTTDVNGNVYKANHFRDKVTVLGFVFQGKDETLRAIETMCELRREFSACDVDVLAFSTDKDDFALEPLIAAFDDTIPVLDGRAIAHELRLFQCGVPVIIVCDRQGRLRMLHACQAAFTSGIIFDQVRLLIDQTGPGDGLTKSALSRQGYDATFPRRKINRFDQFDTQSSLVSVD